MPETAKRTARVPILGEDGRISDDYIPAAIGENVTKAESAATRAESAATAAEGSASAARQSAMQAAGSATTTQQQAAAAQGSATAASESATAAAGSATTAQGHAQAAASSATQAAQSAQQVADKYIIGATATTLGPGEQATAQVVEQVLQLGIPQGEKGDKGNPGDKGDPGDRGDPGTAATVTVGTTQTGEPGTDASVTNSGTTSAAVLDFTIPRGEKGDKGDPGTGVPDGGTPGQLLSKTDSGTAWVDPPSTGNVLVGEAEGYVAHAEDAYAQKPLEVRLKGKTWVNRWPVLSGTHNGITVATDETGLVTVTGTATADADVTADVSGWATGKSYTTMVSAAPTGCSAYFEVQKPSGNTSINATTTGATLNVASDATNCVAGVHVTSGATVNTSFRVMLVDGTEAPDCFTPPASIASAQPGNLVTAGKNLVNTSGASVLANNFGVRLPNVTLQPGTYVVKRPSGLTGNFAIYRDGDTSSQVTTITEADTSFTLTSPIHGLDFRSSDAGQITLDNISQFQLELGSTATAYEPPTVTTTPLPEVELRSLPNGTCDELVIKSDGTCVVERKAATVLFDGTQSLTAELRGNGRYRFRYQPSDAGPMSSDSTGLCSDNLIGTTAPITNNSVEYAVCQYGPTGAIFISLGDEKTAEEANAWFADNPTTVIYYTTGTTESKSPVTLPTLPAPTFNQYHDADVPSDTTVTYERDINIALDNLAKQVAGTASAVAVREASTIEEE